MQDSNSLIKPLNELVTSKKKTKGELEHEIKLPRNSLASVLSGKKEMPKKWITKIEEYLKKYNGEIVFKDGTFTTSDPTLIDALLNSSACAPANNLKMEEVIAGPPVFVRLKGSDHFNADKNEEDWVRKVKIFLTEEEIEVEEMIEAYKSVKKNKELPISEKQQQQEIKSILERTKSFTGPVAQLTGYQLERQKIKNGIKTNNEKK